MGPGLFADGQTDEPMVYLIPCLQIQYNAQLRNRLFPMEKSIPMFSQAKKKFFFSKENLWWAQNTANPMCVIFLGHQKFLSFEYARLLISAVVTAPCAHLLGRGTKQHVQGQHLALCWSECPGPHHRGVGVPGRQYPEKPPTAAQESEEWTSQKGQQQWQNACFRAKNNDWYLVCKLTWQFLRFQNH